MKDNEVIESLRSAGIPKKYASPKVGLSSIDGLSAARMLKWVTESSREEISLGKSIWFHPDSPDNTELLYYTARALLISGHAVKVMPMVLLARVVWEDDFRQVASETDVFGITGFYDPHYKKAYSEETLNAVEWFVRRRMLNEQSTMFLSAAPIAACDWYSPTCLQMIASSVGSMRF